MISWALDSETWDIGVNKNTKSIALVEDGAQIAQDVASSVRVWLGELPMDVNRGINYGEPESLRGVLNFEMKEQAKRIEGVEEAQVIFNKMEDRVLDATIYVTTTEGTTIEVR